MKDYLEKLKQKLKAKNEFKLKTILDCYAILLIFIVFSVPATMIALILSLYHHSFSTSFFITTITISALVIYKLTKSPIQKIKKTLKDIDENKLKWLKDNANHPNLYRLELFSLITQGISSLEDVEKALELLENKKASEALIDMIHFHMTTENACYKDYCSLIRYANHCEQQTNEHLEIELKEEVEDYLQEYNNKKLSPKMKEILNQSLSLDKNEPPQSLAL